MPSSDSLSDKKESAEQPRDQKKAGGTTQPGELSRSNAPGTQIAYSADLIAQLTAEHQRLLELFALIKKAFAEKDLPATARCLDQFRSAIQAHLLTENIRIYIYLEHSLTHDPESAALVRGFRHEMDKIGRAVLSFLNKYSDIGTRPDLAIPFGNDLDVVDEVLVDRIRREEGTLYPLYFRVY